VIILIGFGLGCLTIQLIVLLGEIGRSTVVRLYSVLLVLSGLVLAIPLISPYWQWLAWDVTTATPAVFWLLCHRVFNGDRPSGPFSLIAVYSFLAPVLGRQLGANEMSAANPLSLFLWELPRLSEYFLIVAGLAMVWQHWAQVECRQRRCILKLGVFLTVGLGALVVCMSLNLGLANAMFLPTIVSLCALLSAGLLLSGKMRFLEPASTTPSDINSHDDRASNMRGDTGLKSDAESVHYIRPSHRLQRLMCSGYYRTEGLTLKRLAQQLDLPLHKTRALINEEMGFRSFSDYINQLRIKEATERLVLEPQTPVLNIALDVGYRNISSFNRTFKELTKLTPTQYRHADTTPQVYGGQQR